MKYVLLFCGTEEASARFWSLPPEELQQRYAVADLDEALRIARSWPERWPTEGVPAVPPRVVTNGCPPPR